MTNTKETKAEAQKKIVELTISAQGIEYKRFSAWVHDVKTTKPIDVDVTSALQADTAVKTYAYLEDAIKSLSAKRRLLKPVIETIVGEKSEVKYNTSSFDTPESYEAVLIDVLGNGIKVKPIQQVKDLLVDHQEIFDRITVDKPDSTRLTVKTVQPPLVKPVLFNV